MPRGRPPAGSTAALLENRPKGKMTAYAFFVQTCRQEHKRKHPDEVVDFPDFAKKCAARWKTMNEKEKRRFNQMAEDDKRRYEVEMANFISPGRLPAPHFAAAAAAAAAASGAGRVMGGLGVVKRRRKRRLKDPNAPKRCMSAFFWFSQDERPKVRAANPDFAVGEIAKELGRRWSEASDPIRAKYEALAEKDRARYDRDKRAYQQKLKDEKNGVLNPAVATNAATTSSAAAVAAGSVAPPASAVPDEDEDSEEEEEEEEGESE